MTTPEDQQARALIDSAAAVLGWTTAGPSKRYPDDPEPGPMPATVTDPATGRALIVRRITYPAAQAGRLAMSPRYPADPVTGRVTYPPTSYPAATVAPTTPAATPAATLARRLARYMQETADSYRVARDQLDAANDHDRRTQATRAALIAGGWTCGNRHDTMPCPPRLPGLAHTIAESVNGDHVRVTLAGLTAAQALAAVEAVRAHA
jgi:hypothetical protein